MLVLVRYLLIGVAKGLTSKPKSDNLIAFRMSLLPTLLVTSPIYSTVSNTAARTTQSFAAARRLRISNRYRVDAAPMSKCSCAGTGLMRRGRRN